jgi:hypothetical protein
MEQYSNQWTCRIWICLAVGIQTNRRLVTYVQDAACHACSSQILLASGLFPPTVWPLTVGSHAKCNQCALMIYFWHCLLFKMDMPFLFNLVPRLVLYCHVILWHTILWAVMSAYYELCCPTCCSQWISWTTLTFCVISSLKLHRCLSDIKTIKNHFQ